MSHIDSELITVDHVEMQKTAVWDAVTETITLDRIVSDCEAADYIDILMAYVDMHKPTVYAEAYKNTLIEYSNARWPAAYH
jgi:hypothetical protein